MCIHFQHVSITNVFLQINGENLLTIEYNRIQHTEVVMDTDMNEILVIQYNNAGQPVHIVPAEPVMGMNITYNDKVRPNE